MLSWALLRVQGGILKKATVLGACFVVVNAWMAFIIANRSTMSITAALKEKGFNLSNKEKTRHEGLNMYEELCWVNTFMESGSYTPNWGARYFAEAVNFIPRTLWPGKPLIGIDYAIARGQGGGDAVGAGVWASISTGLIGQGVVNFGWFLGPFAAALLMGFWVSALARLDLHIQELGRIPLFASGLILTFNLGRDITLITLYPFVFGVVVVWWLDRFYSRTLYRPKSCRWMALATRKRVNFGTRRWQRVDYQGYTRRFLRLKPGSYLQGAPNHATDLSKDASYF